MNAAIAYPPRLRRIALLTDRFVVGGGAEHIYQIARGMPEVEFGIFADGGDDTGRFENLLNVQLFRGGYAPQEVLRYKPDLIHVHHLRPLTRLFLNPLRRYRMPVYFTAHGMHIHQYEFLKGPLNMLKHRLRYQLERYLFHRVDKVVAVSREDCRFIETAYRVRGCEYIPNGIDCRGIENITLGKTALRRELALPENAWLFLTVARFPFQKGHDVLLEAVARIQQDLRERGVMFVLVGGMGQRFSEIQALAEALGVSDLVRFTGSRDDVYRFMKACDLLLLPSRWEGLPITLLEAAVCRLPMLVSDTYGNREIVTHRHSGLMFENENPAELAKRMLEILDGRYDLVKLAGRACLETLAQYALPDMLMRLRKLYFPHKSYPKIQPQQRWESVVLDLKDG